MVELQHFRDKWLEPSLGELQTELAGVQGEISALDTGALVQEISLPGCVAELMWFILISFD
jgi:hypothetical protein